MSSAVPPDALLVAYALVAARCLPITQLAPVFGGGVVAVPVRVAVGLVLAALAALQVIGRAPVATTGLELALLLGRELAVGVVLGFVVSAVFRAAEAAGALVDVVRGATMAEVLAPLSGERSSPFAALALLLTTTIFLELGGLPHLAVALARTYEVLPPGGAAAASGWGRVVPLVLSVSGGLLEGALGLAAPVIVAVLLADVVLGVIARAAPAVPVFFLGMPVKALLGVGVVLLVLGSVQAVLTGMVASVPGWVARAASVLR